jgi:Ankyrin repeats (3 copies)
MLSDRRSIIIAQAWRISRNEELGNGDSSRRRGCTYGHNYRKFTMPRLPTEALKPETIEFLDRLLGGFVEQGRLASAFGEAARWGYISYLRRRLDDKFPVDSLDENGVTALMKAASGGQLSALRLLLEAGANVNAQDPDGMTPLMWNLAGMHKPKVYVDCCRLLLEHGADPNVRAIDGKNAMWWASERDSNEPLLELLRSFGAAE